MRIAIDLLIAGEAPGGMLLATRALLEGLAQIDQTNEYIIITSRPQDYAELAAKPNIRIYTVTLRFKRGILLQHQLILPGVLRKLKPDVLHVPAFAAPPGWNGPLVITVHDLAFLTIPQQSSRFAQWYWRYVLKESVRRARRVIAVSEQTRDELMSYWHVKPERISLIHNVMRSSLRYEDVTRDEVEAVQERYGRQYLLYTGRIMPRKNVKRLIEAFDIVAARFDDLHLVQTGGAGFGSEEVIQRIEASPYRERIHQAGWVSDQELGALYTGAAALVFPSHHEGFGLPIVEAMACGTPVVASNEAASREVAGDAVVRADCTSAEQLADAIALVLTDGKLRERLICQGKVQVQSFINVEVGAMATRQVYQEVAGLHMPSTSSIAPDNVQLPTHR